MAETTEERFHGSPEGAAAVVNQLAIFLKAAFIYPREHRRVQITADAFLEEIDRWLDPLTWVPLRIRGADDIVVGDHQAEPLGPHAAWMQECFRDAVLAGLELGPAIDAETLFDLADCLRQTMGKNAPEFSQVWPADHGKLIPLDLVFKGGHTREGNQGGFGSGHELTESESTASGTGGPAAAGASAHDVWKNELVRKLHKEPRIHSKLTSIAQCLGKETLVRGGGGAVGELDLLGEVVRLIPTDVRAEHEDMSGVLEQVLESIQSDLLTAMRDDSTEVDGGFLRTALAVAQKYFENRPGDDVVANESAPTGWPADDRIEDDVEQLIAEIEALPEPGDLRMPAHPALMAKDALGAELLGIYLYLLSKAERPETLQALQACLGGCLREPSYGQRRVLHAYFRDLQEMDVSTGVPARHPAWRILSALHGEGLSELIHGRDYLKPEHVAASFPDHFPLYVQSLGSKPEDVAKLRRAVRAIDPEAVEEGIEKLKQEGGLEEQAVLDKLLSVGGEPVLPLITVIAYVDEPWARTRVAWYLRRMKLPTQESSALSCVEPPGSLPCSYLVDLCRLAATKKRDWKVMNRSAELVRDFITRVEDDPDMDELRLHAIWALRLLASPETQDFLEELRKSGRLTRLSARARATRKAAAASLEVLRRNTEPSR
jgi:hypothetical protein